MIYKLDLANKYGYNARSYEDAFLDYSDARVSHLEESKLLQALEEMQEKINELVSEVNKLRGYATTFDEVNPKKEEVGG